MKKLIPILILTAAIGFGIGTYLFSKGHDETADIEAAFSMTADNAVQEFLDDQTASAAKYIDQVIEISGPVMDIEKTDGKVTGVKISSDDMYVVSCTFQNPMEVSEIAGNITVKGVCSGFNGDAESMMPGGVLELKRASIVK
jgi:uroporphyrinogen-III decarboxylase